MESSHVCIPTQAPAESRGAEVVDRGGAARPPEARFQRSRPQGIVPLQVEQEQSTDHG